MLRTSGNIGQVDRQPWRRGASSPLVPAVLIAGLFTLVVTAALLLTHSSPSSNPDDAASGQSPAQVADKQHQQSAQQQDVPDEAEAADSQNTHLTKTNTSPAGASVAADDDRADDTNRGSRKAGASVTPTDTQRTSNFSADGGVGTASTSPRDELHRRVNAHLAAGEFGPALKLASNVADRREKSRLLKQIAAAWRDAEETQAAARTLRRIPVERERREANREHVRQWASAAGGSGADFTQLKELIQNETSGPWFELDGVGGTMSELETGVRVDPNGMLSHLTREEFTGRLKALGIRARRADLNGDMARRSQLRLVSLTRLEKEVRRRLAAGEPVVETMKNLAGLYKVEYVFVYPQSGEIVIGGPAEGWKYNTRGRPVSLTDEKPTLQLDDFVTVFRTFSPEGNGFFNCLIVPRPEGLKKTRALAEATRKRGPLPSGGTRRYVEQLVNAMGPQDVKVNGVPLDSRVARVIVEADYRMKLIGIDKLNATPAIPSYFDLLAKHPQQNAPSLDALRWWLTMKYDAVLHSKDRRVFHIQGSSVLCQGLNEKITPDGRRVHTGKADPVNRLFAVNFTQHYDDLARRNLIFADLQNVFDLSLVAALIRHERLDRETNWDGGVFAVGGDFQPARFEPPKTVPTVGNYRRNVAIQVAGGVRADLMSVVRNPELRREAPRLGSLRDTAKAPELPDGRWWWDVTVK